MTHTAEILAQVPRLDAAGIENLDAKHTTRIVGLGFVVLLGLFILMLALGLNELSTMEKRVESVVNQGMQQVALAQEMQSMAQQRAVLLMIVAHESDPFMRDDLILKYDVLGGRFAMARQNLLRQNLDAREQEIMQWLALAVERSQKALRSVINAAVRDDLALAQQRLVKDAVPVQSAMLVKFTEMTDYALSKARTESAAALKAYERTRNLALGGGLLTLVCGFGIASWMRHRLLGLVAERTALSRNLQHTLKDLNFQKQAMDEHAIVSILDAAGNFIYVNDKFTRISGYQHTELLGASQSLIRSNLQAQRHIDEMWACTNAGQIWHGEVCHRSKAGHAYWVDSTLVPFLQADGAIAHYIVVSTDISAAKANEASLLNAKSELEKRVDERTAALREQLHFITELTEALPNPVFHKDMDGHYLNVNRAWEELFGIQRSQIIGTSVEKLLGHAPEVITQHQCVSKELQVQNGMSNFEIAVPVADGVVRNLQYYKAALTNYKDEVTGIVGVIVDVTERKRSEAELLQRFEEVQALNAKLQDVQHQLLQSEKMASIGQLAAGVAHEINNPIGYVFSNLGSLEYYLNALFGVVDSYERAESAITDPALLNAVMQAKQTADLGFLKQDVPSLMVECKEGVTRVKKIVQDLKDFSRIDAVDEWHWSNLQQGIDTTLNIVWNELKYKVEVKKDYADIPEVECRISQLNQVFMNLLVNAGHAIETKGVITIRTGHTEDRVWVEVEDSGKGIAEENLSRIFDPFFTTKPIGQGTGLGLSLSYGIVQKHGGQMEVRSVVGQGTTFRVWLPIHQSAPEVALESVA